MSYPHRDTPVTPLDKNTNCSPNMQPKLANDNKLNLNFIIKPNEDRPKATPCFVYFIA